MAHVPRPLLLDFDQRPPLAHLRQVHERVRDAVLEQRRVGGGVVVPLGHYTLDHRAVSVRRRDFLADDELAPRVDILVDRLDADDLGEPRREVGRL